MGTLIILSGLVIAGLGLVMALRSLRWAYRTHMRTARRSSGAVDGWESWFLGGFSTLSTGLRGLGAVTMCSAFSVTGIGLIGFGIRLLRL